MQYVYAHVGEVTEKYFTEAQRKNQTKIIPKPRAILTVLD
jgi:hypothetical protein